MKGESTMFLRKVLSRTVAATATTGLLAAPLVLTTAPAFTNVACLDDASQPTTRMALPWSSAQYGTKTLATVDVAPERSGEIVTFELNGPARAQSIDKRIDENGHTQWLLPRGLVAGNDYEVSVRAGGCTVADTKTYTVSKATAEPKPAVAKARKGKFRTTVVGGGGLDPATGPAEFVVRKRGGGFVDSKVAFLEDGVAAVNLKNLRRGRYVLSVAFNAPPAEAGAYRLNRNFKEGASKLAFRVR